jgi:SAM-dependent methyltransferase
MPRSWDDLFADQNFHWREPDAGVVALAPLWREAGFRRVYDLGCGAGRHLAYLESAGFRTFGTDISPHGLAACREALGSAQLPARLVLADMTHAPFGDASFDCGLSTNVLNHNPRALLVQALAEVHRVLRPGGEFFLTVLNPWDWRHGSGVEVEPDSFVLAEGPETGILHHFFSESDLRDWLEAFEILDLRRERGELLLSTRPADRPVLRDAWAVRVRKQ